MNDQPKSDPPAASRHPRTNDRPEYDKPQVAVLGDLRELTEGGNGATQDIAQAGSQPV
jgi:hypothetical protein